MTETPYEITDTDATTVLDAEPADPKAFDLADWITGGTSHRRREVVTVYRDASLASRIEALEKQIKDAKANGSDMDSLGDSSAASLEAERAQLLEALDAASADVEVFALIDPEIKAVEATLGEKPEGYNYAADITYWYAILAESATLQGQRLTAEQWRRVHETIGNQLRLIINAYIASQRPDVTPAFRR